MTNIIQAIKEGLKNTFDLTKRVKILNPCSNIDAHYGPYTSLDEAKTALQGLLTPTAIGRTIGVISDNKVIEYWLQPVLDKDGNLTKDGDGNTICDFVIKQCIDIEEITPNLISVDKTSIDALFDDDETNPSLGSEWQSLTSEEQGVTRGTGE